MLRWQLVMILACAELAVGARILAFLPFPAKSHHIAFQPMLRGLAAKGHQVDYVTAVPLPDPPKTLKHIIVKDLLADLHEQLDMKVMMELTAPGQTIVISEMSLYVSEKLFNEEPSMAKLLSTKVKYDVVLLEAAFGQEYSTAFCHKFQAACVLLHPLLDCAWVNELSGLPDNPSYMIDFKAQTTNKLNFMEKIHNLYISVSTIALSYYYAAFPQQALADKFLRYEGWENRPSVVKMASDFDLILINSHHSIGYPYPKAPHVKEVGGMNLAPNKPLPEDLQKFMDSAKSGVIYLSYGSNVDMAAMMKEGKFDAFVKAFDKMNQKVLWKWKGSEIPKLSNPNVLIREWFPQQDVLAHKNTKLFITHGGLMSLIEAINFGVPVVGTPVFGDQPKNLKFIEEAGIGLELEYNNITEKSLSWAVNEVLRDPRYRIAMKKRQELFQDRPMKPVDEAVYWVEYVARHGKVLQPASVHMPFYQVYLLDVIGFLLGSLLIITWVIRRILRALFSLCGGKSSQPVNPVKKRQ